MTGYALKAVEGNPFSGPKLTPVDGNPFDAPKTGTFNDVQALEGVPQPIRGIKAAGKAAHAQEIAASNILNKIFIGGSEALQTGAQDIGLNKVATWLQDRNIAASQAIAQNARAAAALGQQAHSQSPAGAYVGNLAAGMFTGPVQNVAQGANTYKDMVKRGINPIVAAAGAVGDTTLNTVPYVVGAGPEANALKTGLKVAGTSEVGQLAHAALNNQPLPNLTQSAETAAPVLGLSALASLFHAVLRPHYEAPIVPGISPHPDVIPNATDTGSATSLPVNESVPETTPQEQVVSHVTALNKPKAERSPEDEAALKAPLSPQQQHVVHILGKNADQIKPEEAGFVRRFFGIEEPKQLPAPEPSVMPVTRGGKAIGEGQADLLPPAAAVQHPGFPVEPKNPVQAPPEPVATTSVEKATPVPEAPVEPQNAAQKAKAVKPENKLSETKQLDIGQEPLYSKDDTKDLIAQHNLTAENINHIDKIGGLAVPSVAITHVDRPIKGYGDISLLGSHDLINPRNGAKVFGSDVYSPRHPEVIYRNASTHTLNDILKPFVKESDGPPYKNVTEAKVREIARMPAFSRYLTKERGIAKRAQTYSVRENEAERLIEGAGGEPSIFKGFTQSGYRRYKEYNLDNAVLEMKKELRGGESGGAGLFGSGPIRSKVTPQFKSIKEIRAARGKIVSENDFEPVKKEVNQDLLTLAEKMKETRKAHHENPFMETDAAVKTIADVPKYGMKRALELNGFARIPEELQGEIKDYLNKLRNLPTAYFEAILPRAVGLNEFHTAVVPHNADNGAVDVLRKNGIKIRRYKGGNEEDRARVIKSAAKESIGTLFYRDEGSGINGTQAESKGGNTPEQVKSALSKQYKKPFDKAVASGRVNIVQSEFDLPQSEQNRMLEKGTFGKVGGFWNGKHITLIADNIRPGHEGGVLLHEALHSLQRGLRKASYADMVGNRFDDLSADFKKLLDSGDETAIRAERRAQRSGETGARLNAERQAYLVTEWLDHGRPTVGKAADLVRKIIARLRAWVFSSPAYVALKKAGIEFHLTPEDFAALAQRGLKSDPEEPKSATTKPLNSVSEPTDNGQSLPRNPEDFATTLKKIGLDPEKFGYSQKDVPAVRKAAEALAEPAPKAPESTQFPTGIKRAVVDEEREKRGEDAIEIAGKRSNMELWQDARSQLDKDPSLGINLAEELSKGKRAPNPVEVYILTQDRARIARDSREADREIVAARKNGNKTAESVALLKRETSDQQMKVNDEAARKTAYLQGLTFQLRKALSQEDYSMASMVTRFKARSGRDPTPAERENIQALHDKIAEQEDKIAELQRTRAGRRRVTPAAAKTAHQRFTDYADQFRKLRKDKQLDCVT